MTPNPKVLLIVDDEETIHRALVRTFRREPYEILHAYDAAEAWDLLLHGPCVSLVISDHYMDGTYGLDLLQEVRAKFPHIATVLLTGHADLRLALRAINQGLLHRFFTKPWEPEPLRQDIRELLATDPSAKPRVDPSMKIERQLAADLLPEREAGTGAFIIEAPSAD